MKLNSFKFQDGKVSWLPEYPEKIDHACTQLPDHDCPICSVYTQDAFNSLASAIEVAPEDMEGVKHYCFMQSPGVSGILSASHLWQPEKDKVYSAECEIWIVYQCLASQIWGNVEKPIYDGWLICYPQNVRQVARLKPKEEIFPAANSHDMKDEADLDK